MTFPRKQDSSELQAGRFDSVLDRRDSAEGFMGSMGVVAGQPVGRHVAHFLNLLDEQGITCSMNRVDEVSDNLAMKSFFSSLKNRAHGQKGLSNPWASPFRHVRPHRVLLQPDALAFDA